MRGCFYFFLLIPLLHSVYLYCFLYFTSVATPHLDHNGLFGHPRSLLRSATSVVLRLSATLYPSLEAMVVLIIFTLLRRSTLFIPSGVFRSGLILVISVHRFRSLTRLSFSSSCRLLFVMTGDSRLFPNPLHFFFVHPDILWNVGIFR